MSFEIEGLDELINKLEKGDSAIKKELSDAVNKLGTSLVGRVKRKTPVGKSYKNYTGGTLRRNWHVKKIDKYTVRVYNNTHYAGYVEFGHRTRGGKSFVEGQYMLTKSVEELSQQREEMNIFESIIQNIW